VALTGNSVGGKEYFLASKYWIEIDGVMEAFFTECTGLTVQTEVFEYREGGLNTRTHRLPVRTNFTNITLKRGMEMSPKLWEWYAKTVKGTFERRNISIILYSKEAPSVPKRRWNISGAYPIKWATNELRTESQEFLIESIELVHNGFTMITHT
jgi:phage tail-like protein